MLIKKLIIGVIVLLAVLAAALGYFRSRPDLDLAGAAAVRTDAPTYASQQIAKAKAGPIDRLLGHVVAPGTLAEAHKDIGSCFACHSAFKSEKETGCADCHLNEQLLGSDRPNAAVTHEQVLGKATCTACHTDHRGPDAKITLPFEHTVLPPPTLASCASCHASNKAVHMALSLDDFADSSDVGANKARLINRVLHQNHAQGFAGASCSECHSTQKWTPASFVHTRVIGKPATGSTGRPAQGISCSECHLSETQTHVAQGKYSENCQACHSVAAWKPTVFSHTRKASAAPAPPEPAPATRLTVPAAHPPGGPAGCTACHAREVPPHGNQYGSTCGSCHNTTQWSGATRDPLSVTAVEGVASCAACHLDKMKTHLDEPAFGANCSLCHSMTTWKAVRMDHSLTKGMACTKCHADPETPSHPKAAAVGITCSACHTTNAWRPAAFDHSGLTDRSAAACTACHVEKTNGVHQGGRAFNADCTLCHNPQNPAGTAFSHKGASARTSCSACHARDIPVSPNHKPFVATCAVCHSTTSWRPAQFQHKGVVGFETKACLSCHAAEYRYHDTSFLNQAGRTCEQCHDTNRWRPANFNHDAAVNSRSLTCLSCHRMPNNWLHVNASPKGCLSCHNLQGWSTFAHGG